MAINVNQVTLAGNLTRAPEVRFLPSGTPVCNISIAVNNRTKKGDEWVDDPCFVDVIIFGKSAEFVGNNVDKGQPVLVTGRLQFRSWEDKEGNKRSKHEVVADRIFQLNANSGGGKGREREPGEDDDVPF